MMRTIIELDSVEKLDVKPPLNRTAVVIWQRDDFDNILPLLQTERKLYYNCFMQQSTLSYPFFNW